MPPSRRPVKSTKAGSPGRLKSALSHRGLLLILLAGVAARMWNIGWGLPHLYEEAIPLRFGMKLWPSLPPSIDYHFFVYPALGYYLHLAAQFLHFCLGSLAGAQSGLAAFIAGFDADPTSYAVVSRLLTVTVDAGIVVACYAVADRRFGRGPALIAAAFIALNALHVKQAHLVNVDTLLAFFSVLLLPALFSLTEAPAMRSYVVSGIVLGLAAASKYNGAILALPIVVAHLIACGGVARALEPRRMLGLAGAALASIVVFLACNPLILTHVPEFLVKFSGTETHMESGHLGLDPGTSTAGYYLLESLPSILGIPIALVALGSLGWMLYRRDPRHLLLLSFPAAYAAMLFTWQMRADRYVFPAVPFLLMIAAIGLWEAFSRRILPALARSRAGESRGNGRAAWMPAVACALLLVPGVREIAAYQGSLEREDTRTAAMEWIEANIPTGSAIAAGPFGIELPPKKYINLMIQFSAVNSERMTPFYNPAWYRDVDLVVASGYDYERYRMEPARFRTILGYLDTLTNSWELVRSFEPGDVYTGPSVRLFRHPGESSDDPFPESLIAELLNADLEQERKVAFLGKLGLILSVRGKLTRSEQLLRTLLTLEPGNETALRSLRDIERYRAARGTAGAPGGAPSSGAPAATVDSLAALGDELIASGDIDAAERSYRRALALDSAHVNSWLGITMVHALKDDRAGVVRTLKHLLSILPKGSDDYRKVLSQLQSIEGNPR